MISELTQIENRASTISLIDEDIVKVFIKPDLDFEKKDVDDIRNSIEKLSEGNRVLTLVDVSENTTGNSEVREYGSKEGANKYATATAYITDSLAQRIVVNFFINLYRKGTPTRIFNSEDKAIEWLKSHRN
jgi:hypothetical protein